MKDFLLRLDKAAAIMNAWLFAVALGLAFLDFSVLMVKAVEAVPPYPGPSVSAPSHPSRSG